VLRAISETISFPPDPIFEKRPVAYMDSLEFNKMAGAVLGTALLVLGLKTFGGEIFRTEAPEKPGMNIEVAEATPAAAAGADSGGAATPALSLGTLLAKADAAKGQATAKACGACHVFDKGGANKVGPHLWDIVQRPIGSAENFAYSEGFKAMNGKVWGYDELNAWLKAPKEYIKGTKMAYAGISKDQDRANLIAYLASLSDSPKPFPAP
jgi:cytochrome c